ncbi:MbnP family protein [uncultured Pontibacter sp.]|uniref:MbnP family protein n=1 Tax=uncultured Pontibacter sp. TaxID=453356 RepID=UPI00260230C0|nr:MbnP family protein [uncultured Pontibacter sp.]
MKRIALHFLICTLAVFLLSGCSNSDEYTAGNVTVEVQNMVGSEALQLETKTYTSPAGDTYSVSNFKYYISNVKLISQDGQRVFIEPDSYHLIAQGGKTAFELKDVPAGVYTSLEMAIGIDQARNHSTDQYGDLDPSNEMAWDWDTGYKFLTLVGAYSGNTKTGNLVFHVGGDANYKTVTMNLPQAVDIRAKPKYNLTLQADVNELFGGPNLIDFDVMNTGGHGAGPSVLAENYSNGFLKVTEVK